MSIESNSLKSELIDGQIVFFPNEDEWKLLKEDPEIDGIRLGSDYVVSRIWRELEFIQQYPEFSLGLFQTKLRQWWFSVLMEATLGWQRVYIESIGCNVCGWRKRIANPAVIDSYLGVPNSSVAIKASARHKEVPCPVCGSKLPRPAIWVEN